MHFELQRYTVCPAQAGVEWTGQAMATSFTKGDKVRWKTPQGETEGTVVRQVTASTKAGGHTAKATTSAPQVEVKSAKTGRTAIHKPTSLKKAAKS
jgi:hypothetical protein